MGSSGHGGEDLDFSCLFRGGADRRVSDARLDAQYILTIAQSTVGGLVFIRRSRRRVLRARCPLEEESVQRSGSELTCRGSRGTLPTSHAPSTTRAARRAGLAGAARRGR